MRVKIRCLLIGVLILGTLFCRVSAVSPFPDVDERATFADAAAYVNSKGIIVGKSNGEFGPYDELTRGAISAIVCRMLGVAGNPDAPSVFDDIPKGHTFHGYIVKAVEFGLIKGYSDGTYRPANGLTQNQAVTVLLRAFGLQDEAEKAGGYPKGYVAVAQERGLLDGILFRGSSLTKRYEVAVIIYNYYVRSGGNGPSSGTPQSGTTQISDPKQESILTKLSGKTFTFASGAGGWHTELTFGANGNFEGNYYSIDMGNVGTAYPKGTVSTCDFTGNFIDIKKIDEFTYSIQISTLNNTSPIGREEIKDEVRYVYVDPYGMENADLFYLYLPGRSTSGLPNEFIEWVSMPNAWKKTPSTLPFWGLYNEGGKYGFFSN